MQTYQYLKHLNQAEFEKVVKSEIIFEFLADDLERLCYSRDYSVSSFSDWYRYGVEQTKNQKKFQQIDYTDRQQRIRELVMLVFANMRKWFAQNDHDATRVKQRLSYKYFIQNMHDTVTISFAGVLAFLRKLKTESLSFRRKIREKVYHFFHDNFEQKARWCKFLGFTIYKKRVKQKTSNPIKLSDALAKSTIKKVQPFLCPLYTKQLSVQSIVPREIKLLNHSFSNSFNFVCKLVNFNIFVNIPTNAYKKPILEIININILLLGSIPYNQVPPAIAKYAINLRFTIFAFLSIMSILSFNSIDKLYHKGVKNG